MRLVVLGLFVLLIAIAALAIANLPFGELVRNTAAQERLTTFENRDAGRVQSGGRNVRLRREGPDPAVILSGLPAYETLRFTMPRDARPVEGHLQLAMTSQVYSGVEAVARISINGARRGEIILPPGKVYRTVRIDLAPRDLAAPRLDVAVSLHGSGQDSACAAADAINAVVEIEPTSGIFLRLDKRMSSPRDRIAAWGNSVPVSWPPNMNDDEKAERLVLAARLAAAGEDVVFVSARRGNTLSVEQLAGMATDQLIEETRANFPLSFFSEHDDPGLRRFYRSVNWRRSYDIADLPDGRLPAGLDLALWLGPLPATPPLRPRLADDPAGEDDLARLTGGAAWTVTATLNGRIVHQERTDVSVGEYRASIDLPPDYHRRGNLLEVRLSADAGHGNLCDRGPEMTAELLGATRLVGGGEMYSDGLLDLRDRLAEYDTVALVTRGSLSGADADHVVSMLTELSGNYTANAGDDGAVVTVLGGDTVLSDLLEGRDDAEHWLVAVDIDDTDRVTTHPVLNGSVTNADRLGPSILLVSVPVRDEARATTPSDSVGRDRIQ